MRFIRLRIQKPPTRCATPQEEKRNDSWKVVKEKAKQKKNTTEPVGSFKNSRAQKQGHKARSKKAKRKKKFKQQQRAWELGASNNFFRVMHETKNENKTAKEKRRSSEEKKIYIY